MHRLFGCYTIYNQIWNSCEAAKGLFHRIHPSFCIIFTSFFLLFFFLIFFSLPFLSLFFVCVWVHLCQSNECEWIRHGHFHIFISTLTYIIFTKSQWDIMFFPLSLASKYNTIQRYLNWYTIILKLEGLDLYLNSIIILKRKCFQSLFK